MPAEIRTFFGVDIEFGANADEIWFPRPIALLSVVGRDERLNELLRRYAEKAPARKPRERLMPISEIAWLLGYREISSLTHAFKRWTGMTPRRFRSDSGQLAST
jgi:AraC-like DNA-binding protein